MSTAANPNDTNDPQSQESFWHRRAPLIWGAFVIAFLGGQVAMGIVAVILATGDPSFAVVPDYHEKAMHWDDSTQIQTASDELGWTASIELSAAADAVGARTIVVKLTDRSGQPIEDASLHLRAFHHARAGEPVRLSLRSHQDGHYTAAVPMRREGLWQFELGGTRGDDEQFQISRTIDTNRDKEQG